MRPHEVEIVRKFYETHRGELFTYALALGRSREAAEDAVQSVFRGVLDRSRLPADLRPYLFRSIRNALIDQHRARVRHEDAVSIFRMDARRNNGHDPALAEEIESLMQQLNESERECIVMKTYSGLTFAEIAAVCGTSQNTVASWYRRGLEKMRSLMKEDL
ncbi:MAG: sigma-70 family RNA polymerase sigma factor [Candidatus Hydrogenedentales bacterium]|jgi:RNA polymerase sigma-70 factor (ECF subfamily)